MRIEGGPTVVERGEPFQMEVDGQSIVAFEGETIATALLASGRRVFRHTARTGTPRGLFCGIGVCFECLVTVDGIPNLRSCMTPARPGIKIQLQGG